MTVEFLILLQISHHVTSTSSEWLNVTIIDAYGNTFSDSIHINIQRPVVDLGLDTTICTTESLLLYSQGNYATLLWQNGSNDKITFTAEYIGTDSMIYWLQEQMLLGVYRPILSKFIIKYARSR